jgi:hypothetical protein
MDQMMPRIWVCTDTEDGTCPPGYRPVSSYDDIAYEINEWEVWEINFQMQVGNLPRADDNCNARGLLSLIENHMIRHVDYVVPLMFCHEAEPRDREWIEKRIISILKWAKHSRREVRRDA